MLVSLTVGKVDAGVTVLLTPDKRLIEFPSILLPPDISSGSIVDITVARNLASEATATSHFRALQDSIFASFGAAEPAAPLLRCRNATQTSVVLEWDPVQLATADLVSLSLYRNGQKAGAIPRPTQMHSTKISGLAVDTAYEFHLVLRTTAGTYPSEHVSVRTHKMTDLSGVTITTGLLPAARRDALAAAVERIGAKLVDGVRIDTTHFVTTEGRGLQWEKAVEMNIPVVRPEWVEACEAGGRILGVTKFYLDAVRPGPDENARPPAQAQAQRQPQSPAVQKDLPPTPRGENGAGAAAGGSKDGGRTPVGETSQQQRKEEAVDGDDESEEEDEDEDEKGEGEEEAEKSARLEGQKVRFEEKDKQKVALRPAESKEHPARGSVDDEDDEDEDEASEAGAPEKPSPAGDGSSFQDVAL